MIVGTVNDLYQCKRGGDARLQAQRSIRIYVAGERSVELVIFNDQQLRRLVSRSARLVRACHQTATMEINYPNKAKIAENGVIVLVNEDVPLFQIFKSRQFQASKVRYSPRANLRERYRSSGGISALSSRRQAINKV